MIPGGNTNFTTQPIVGEFLPPTNTPYNPFYQVIWGGIHINDTSKGRKYQYWEVYYDVDTIKFKPMNGTVEFSYYIPDCISVSGCFDQNMSAIVCYQTTNTSNIYFYNISQYETLTINDTTSCRVVVDDIQDYYSSQSDIFFAYTKNNNLYYRIQRQNYANEYLIGSSQGKKLSRIGLTDKNRVQFELTTQ